MQLVDRCRASAGALQSLFLLDCQSPRQSLTVKFRIPFLLCTAINTFHRHSVSSITTTTTTTVSRSMFSLASQRLLLRKIPTTAIRAFSEASHKPLINLHGLQARYANATYVAASKAGKLDQVEAELLGLAKAATDNKNLALFLENPMIPRETKIAFVKSLDKISPLTKNLLVTMAGNARLNELTKVASTFAQLMKAKRGQVEAKIISAEPLSQQALKEVKAAMQSQVPKGKTVVIEAVTPYIKHQLNYHRSCI